MRISFIARTTEDDTAVLIDADALDFLIHHLNVYADDTVALAERGDANLRPSLHTTASYARSLAEDLGYCDSPTDQASIVKVIAGHAMRVHHRD